MERTKCGNFRKYIAFGKHKKTSQEIAKNKYIFFKSNYLTKKEKRLFVYTEEVKKQKQS